MKRTICALLACAAALLLCACGQTAAPTYADCYAYWAARHLEDVTFKSYSEGEFVAENHYSFENHADKGYCTIHSNSLFGLPSCDFMEDSRIKIITSQFDTIYVDKSNTADDVHVDLAELENSERVDILIMIDSFFSKGEDIDLSDPVVINNFMDSLITGEGAEGEAAS